MSTDLDWLAAHGVEFAWWTQIERIPAGDVLPKRLIVGGRVEDAIDRFKPDLIHVFKIPPAHVVLPVAIEHKLSMTVRVHSIDFSVPGVHALAKADRVWVYPEHTKWFTQPNVEALPVAYDPTYFFPDANASVPYVVRAGSGAPGKGLEEFVEIAKLCPDIPFVLIVTRTKHEEYLRSVFASATNNLFVHWDLSNTASANLVRRARVCLRGHDPHSHTYGMPISIVEALGAGLPVIARAGDEDTAAQTGPEELLGDAGFFYHTAEEGADLVREIMAWSPELYQRHREIRALPRARLFRNDVVLPRVLAVWQELTGIRQLDTALMPQVQS
jgi:glycosyltransferase involved in cell wall biosynthesis